MDKKQSRYTIKEYRSGFRIEGEDRLPVTVNIASNGLGFDIATKFKIINNWNRTVAPLEEFDIINLSIPRLYSIVDAVASNLMLAWQPPPKPDGTQLVGRIGHIGWDIRSWAEEQTRKAIAPRLKEQWLRLKERMDPKIVEVQNRVFSVALRVPDWMLDAPNFYQNHYIIRDIMQYRGAAALAAHLERAVQTYYEWNARPSQPWRMLENWMGMYSPTGVAYPALRKTLMNLAGNFPPGPLQRIRHVMLPRAIKERECLLAMTVLGEEFDFGTHVDRFIPVVLRSKNEHFKEMLKIVAENFDWKYGPRTYQRFVRSMKILMDYPGDFGPINILGLTRRAMTYHTDERVRRQLEQRQRAMRGLQPEDETRVPSIPLPENEHVHFLSTVEEIIDEGEQMGHCVGGYAGRAVDGKCYLFHIIYKGKEATIEVGMSGHVIQGSGPNNRINKAVTYGRSVLSKWGSQITPEKHLRQLEYASMEAPF